MLLSVCFLISQAMWPKHMAHKHHGPAAWKDNLLFGDNQSLLEI